MKPCALSALRMSAAAASKFFSFMVHSFGAISSAFRAEGDSEFGFLAAERQRGREFLGFRRHVGAFVLQIVCYRPAERGERDEVSREGGDGPVAPCNFAGAFGAGLDALQ